jgi:hypothetical protein
MDDVRSDDRRRAWRERGVIHALTALTVQIASGGDYRVEAAFVDGLLALSRIGDGIAPISGHRQNASFTRLPPTAQQALAWPSTGGR